MAKFESIANPTTPVSVAAPRLIEATIANLSHFAGELLRDGENRPEDVHQLRVWSRRSSAAVRFFEPLLRRKVSAEVEKRLGQIRRVAGKVRDGDVAADRLRHIREQLTARGQTAVDRRQAALWETAQGARRKLRRKLRSRKIQGFLASHGDGAAERWIRRPERGDATPLADWARPILARRLEKFLAEAAHGARDPEALHRLRILGKRLRYSLEFCASCLPSDVSETLQRAVKRLQDILGAYHDDHVLKGHVGSRDGETGEDEVRSWLDRAMEHQQAALEAYWAETFTPAFRSRLQAVFGADLTIVSEPDPEEALSPTSSQ